MMPGSSIGIFKVIGTFGIIVMMIVWLGPSLVSVGRAMKTGSWSGVLSESGGRVFSVDAMVRQETDYLLENEDTTYTKVFHLAHSISLLFMLFFIGFLLFRFGNWILGIKSLSPSTDLLIILGIILAFFSIEFFYAYKILGKTIIPLKDGVFYFLKNLPKIVNGMIS